MYYNKTISTKGYDKMNNDIDGLLEVFSTLNERDKLLVIEFAEELNSKEQPD